MKSYVIPSNDYTNLIHVINYLRSPELFGHSKITQQLTEFHLKTASVYYYTLVYPLSFVFSGKWIFLTIGSVISWFSAYFAGGKWNKWQNAVTATVVLLVLLHLHVTPLEGNKRSFSALFLLGTLWLGEEHSYWWKVFFVGLASSIYPPIGLLILTYFGLQESSEFRYENRSIQQSLLRISGLLLVFFVILTPYWWDLLNSPVNVATQTVPGIYYDFSSISGVMHTFFGSRVGFLRYPDAIHLFYVLLFLACFQWFVLGIKKLRIRTEYIHLALSTFVLWGLAFLFHPLIYHPFKYSRVSLILILLLFFLDNLNTMVELIREKIPDRSRTRLLLLLMSIAGLSVWSADALNLFGYPNSYEMNILGKFVFGFPVFVTLIYLSPGEWDLALRNFICSVTFVAMIFLPHCFLACNEYEEFQVEVSRFDDLYSYLRKSTAGATVIGPHFYMDPIPAYGKRSIYSSQESNSKKFVCERIKKFWDFYSNDSPRDMIELMSKKDIEYLLVDRGIFALDKIKFPLSPCLDQLKPNKNSVFNQHFDNAVWSHESRFYLLTKDSLQDVS